MIPTRVTEYVVTVLTSGSITHSDARPTGTQEVAGSILRSGNIVSWKLDMKSFLRPFSP